MLPPLPTRQFPRRAPCLPHAAGVATETFPATSGSFVCWSADPPICGSEVEVPPPKTFPRKDGVAPAPVDRTSALDRRQDAGTVGRLAQASVEGCSCNQLQLLQGKCKCRAPVKTEAEELAAAELAAKAPKARWEGPGDFMISPVYKNWTRQLKKCQKLRDKVRAWDQSEPYPVWLIPKERSGQPPRSDEIKLRHRQAVQAKLAKEAAIVEKARLAKEAEKQKQRQLEEEAEAELAKQKEKEDEDKDEDEKEGKES